MYCACPRTGCRVEYLGQKGGGGSERMVEKTTKEEIHNLYYSPNFIRSRSKWLLRLWVRIPQGAWMFVCCECCVLSDRGLCNGLITHPEDSYLVWCVVVCDLETS